MSPNGEPLVRVEHVSKKYCRSLKRSLWYGLRDLGSELIGRRGDDRLRLRKDEFLAVNDVSFELRRGECLGLIGANGAGKSTLLKMLNGLVRPDAGRIEIRGRVGALIELGAGFNPILTGRENIYVNGAVLGLSKREIGARIGQIVDFAELGEFIDSPVQTYSSGMRVRLGYSVAAHLDPDVLLIDEVLAVGDMRFLLKCFNSMEKQLQRSAIVFVSHQLPQVARISTRAIPLDRGKALFEGSPADAINAYLARSPSPIPTFVGDERIRIADFAFEGSPSGRSVKVPFRVRYLDALRFRFRLEVPPQHARPVLYLVIYDREMRAVGESAQPREAALRNENGSLEVAVALPRLNLSQGIYALTIGVKDSQNDLVLARFQAIQSFQVIGEHPMWTPIHFEAEFRQLS